MTEISDERLLSRLSKYGPPTLTLSCTWKGRPAGVALTESVVSVAGSGGTIGRSLVAAEVVRTQVRVNDTSVELDLSGDVVQVEFVNPATALRLREEVEIRARAVRRAAGHRPPVALIGDDQLITCRYVGGAYLAVSAGAQPLVDLVFRSESVEMYLHPAHADDAPIAQLGFRRQLTVDISGPGRITTGGGFVGGGFGLVGAAEGIAIAAALNSLTRRTQVVTVLHLASLDSEGFFVNEEFTPDQLRAALSPVFVRLRRAISRPPEPQSSSDLLSQLQQLASLQQAGMLTDDEFAAAKRRLLEG